MIKFVCKGRKPEVRFLRSFFHANLDRLAEIAAEALTASPEQMPALAREHNAIVRDLCIKGVWKRTNEGRLPETEQVICDYLVKRLPAGNDPTAPIKVLDLGASDGSTTLNLIDAIRDSVDGSIEAYLADISNYLIRYRKGFLFEYRATDGEPAMVRLGRFGHRLPKSEYEWDWISNFFAWGYVGLRRWRENMVRDLDICLVNPRASRCPEIRMIEMDCFRYDETLVDQFDVVRASNVLSPRHFSEKQLESAIRFLHDYLHEGGALVVSRNDDWTDVGRGSIWQKHGGGFQWGADFGGGSELKELVERIESRISVADRSRKVPREAVYAMSTELGSRGPAGAVRNFE